MPSYPAPGWSSEVQMLEHKEFSGSSLASDFFDASADEVAEKMIGTLLFDLA